jgi:hypothetical protein
MTICVAIQNLGRWVSNNWRPFATLKASKSLVRRISRIEVVWRRQREEVECEVQKMIHEKGLESTPQECFQYRTSAAKRVYHRMDEEKKQEIMQVIQEYRTKGNEPEIQRQ